MKVRKQKYSKATKQLTFQPLEYKDKRYEHFQTNLIFWKGKEVGHYQLADFDANKQNPKSYYIAVQPLKMNKKLPIRLFANEQDFRLWILAQFTA